MESAGVALSGELTVDRLQRDLCLEIAAHRLRAAFVPVHPLKPLSRKPVSSHLAC